MMTLFWRLFYMFKKTNTKEAKVEAHCRKYGIKFERLTTHNVVPVDFTGLPRVKEK